MANENDIPAWLYDLHGNVERLELEDTQAKSEAKRIKLQLRTARKNLSEAIAESRDPGLFQEDDDE